MHADIKQRISRLKKQIADQHKKSSTKGPIYKLPRQGAGRAIIVGPANSGKSQLLASLTKAKPVVAEFPYTTIQPMPGMMPWKDVAVQLVDTAPISTNELDQSTSELIRGADLVLLMLDLGSDDGGQELQNLVDFVNGGKTRFGRKTEIDHQNIGVTNTATLLLANKTDLSDAADRLQFFDEFLDAGFDRLLISALTGDGLPELSDRIFQSLDVIRVYTKQPTKKEPDMESPFTIKRGSTLSDLAELVHKDIAQEFEGRPHLGHLRS